MTEPAPRPSRLQQAARIVVTVVVVMWAIELVDAIILDDALERQGIQPRRVRGLDGILFAPFLHDGIGHLIANTIPLAVLTALVLIRGVPRWAEVSAIVIVAGGLATWVLARSANHIGASGLVFGYLGFLLAAGFFERSLKAFALGAVTGLAYGGLLFGVLPTRPGISWESHLFGLLAGILAAWALSRRRTAPEPAV